MCLELIFIGMALTAGPFDGLTQNQSRDADLRWRMPLDQKAERIQADLEARHLVEGTQVSMVPVPADGSPVDHTTTGNTGDMHASTWTGCYLMGTAFQYAWAKEEGAAKDLDKALELGETLVDGLYTLTHISGKPGLLVRKVVYGHGPAIEERLELNERNHWHQGVGEYSHLRFRAHPSHHNYHHVVRGLSFWYYFLQKDNPNPSARERAQLDKTKEILTKMMEYGYKSNNMLLLNLDGSVATDLARAPEGQPSTRGVMATNSLKFAHWITGDPWYRDRYLELVERFGYRTAGDWPADNWQNGREPDHDDTEHTLPSIWLMLQIEEDPELRAFYEMSAASIFESKRHEKRTPFNYFYAAATGDTEGADLEGALETLRLYPSVTYIYPFMHSIRTDIEFAPTRYGQLGPNPVLPFNEQPMDNAYDWKGDPYTMDRWLARPIRALGISDEDAMVWMLADNGGELYQSRDGGGSFEVFGFYHNARVRDVTYAGDKNRVIVLATDRGIFRTGAGGYRNNWDHVPVGRPGNGARHVIRDAQNPFVVWAIMDDGIYRSIDFGVEEVGRAWEKVSGPLPQGRDVVYGLGTGPDAQMYAAISGRLYRRGPDDADWTMSPVDAEGYHLIPEYQQIEVFPDDPMRALLRLRLSVWGRPWNLLLLMEDGGERLTVIGTELSRSMFDTRGSGLDGVELHDIAIDPNDPRRVYGASSSGAYLSTDGGINWRQVNTGLRIPYAHAVFAPRQRPGEVYLSTPAGLHRSSDSGESWESPLLTLVGQGVDPVERGGMGYLVGYWPGRYFGLISGEEAAAPPDSWGY